MQNPVQLARILYHFARLARDPSRLEEVFSLADRLEDTAVTRPIVDAFRSMPEGSAALRDRPRVGTLDLDRLMTLPKGTLGRSFAEHMRTHGLTPDAIPTKDGSGAEWEYVRAHLYETHDIWHAVTGFGTDVAGELGLQAFYLAQFPARLAAVILSLGLANTFLYAFEDRDRRMDAIVRGWVLGRRARPLLGVDWKSLWTTPMDDVRRMFRLDLEGADETARAGESATVRLAA